MPEMFVMRVRRNTSVPAMTTAGYGIDFGYFVFYDESEAGQFRRDMADLYPNFEVMGPFGLLDPKEFIDRARSLI